MAYEYKGLGFSDEDVQSVEHDISGGVLTTTLTLKDGTTKLSGTATLPTTVSSADKLATSRTIDGVSFNGSASINHYASCSTAAATAEKTVTRTGFSLGAGARIAVRFSNTNTASNPKLNVNGTGAKSIYYRNSAITASVLEANRIYEFVYDGNQYELVGDVNVVKNVNGSTTPNKAIYAPTSSGSSGQYLKSNGSNSAPTWVSLPIPADFGTSGQYLKSSGSDSAPTWAAAPTPEYYPIYTHFGTGITVKGLGDLTQADTTLGYKIKITSITGTQPPKVYPTASTFCFWYGSIKTEVTYVNQQSGSHNVADLIFTIPTSSYLAYMLKNSANNEVSFTNDYDAFAICGQTSSYFSMTKPSYFSM